MSKAKVLLFGAIREKGDAFRKKLDSLQGSKAGPFDVCFCVGPCHVKTEGKVDPAFLSLPVPVYLQDAVGVDETSSEDKTQGLHQITTNLFAFPSSTADVFKVSVGTNRDLVVGHCPPHFRMDSTNKTATPLLEKVDHVSYVGCDILLTSDWPQGIEAVISNEDQDLRNITSSPSFDVAEVSLRARARYQVSPCRYNVTTSSSFFWQSPPFRHLASSTSTQQPKHTGRFLALGAVAPGKVPKTEKFVHALGILPLQDMSQAELEQSQQPGTLPCPFTDASYHRDGSNEASSSMPTHSVSTTSNGLSEAQTRRILAEQNGPGDLRWNLGGNNRKRKDDFNKGNSGQDGPVDPANTTLFIYGLHKDVSGQLQSAANGTLLQTFASHGCIKVRKPPNAATSTYAFLEFGTHQDALACLENCGGETVVSGVKLLLKWATHNNGSNQNPGTRNDYNNNPKRPRLTENEAKDSSTLYYRLPTKVLTHEFEKASELVRQWMEETLEEALGDDGGDERVKASDEPALQVQARQVDKDKNFGFLDFASHAAASMALATLTGTVNGGIVLQKEGKESFWGLALHWAHARIAGDDTSTHKNTMIQDANCDFQFQRQHFPADARQDCWFCLASPACERHLITGVYNECYSAMPKGAIHPGHVLLIPVAHTSKGALVGASSVVEEMHAIRKALRKHAMDAYGMDLFVFERAIETKGGYHTHVQCVPVPKGFGPKLETTMLLQAKASRFVMKEINSDLGLSACLKQEGEDGKASTTGYFYAEIPITSSDYKRFLFRQSVADLGRPPLQFGREVLAAVMGNAKLGHWKSCEVSKEEESKLSAEFRKSFSSFIE